MKKLMWHPLVRLPIVVIFWVGVILAMLWLYQKLVDFLFIAYRF